MSLFYFKHTIPFCFLIAFFAPLSLEAQHWTFFSGTHLFGAHYEHEAQPENFRFFGLHLGVGREATLENGWRRQWNLRYELSHSNFPSIQFTAIPEGHTNAIPVRVESVGREGVFEVQFKLLGPKPRAGGALGFGAGFGRSQKIHTTMYYGLEDYWTVSSWDTNIIALRLRIQAGGYLQLNDHVHIQAMLFGFSYFEPAIVSGSSYNVVGWGADVCLYFRFQEKD